MQHFRAVGLGSELKASRGRCIGPFPSLPRAPTLHTSQQSLTSKSVGLLEQITNRFLLLSGHEYSTGFHGKGQEVHTTNGVGGGDGDVEIRNKDKLKGSVASPKPGPEDHAWSHFEAVLH